MLDEEKTNLEVLNLPEDVEEMLREDIKRERFQKEYLGQFIEDDNPEGYKTIDYWTKIDRIRK